MICHETETAHPKPSPRIMQTSTIIPPRTASHMLRQRGLVILACLLACLPRPAPALDPLTVLLEAGPAMELIAEYLGLIESLDSKVDRLLDADLKTAVALLQQARANPPKAGHLIHEARIFFTRAASIESGSADEARRHKRAVALLGLWSCCQADGDTINADAALKDIDSIPETPSPALIVGYNNTPAKIATKLINPFMLDLTPPTTQDYRAFSKDFDSLLAIKESVRKKLKPSPPPAAPSATP